MYRSSYETAQLHDLAQQLVAEPAVETWCVFDNTTTGAAAANALDLQALIISQTQP